MADVFISYARADQATARRAAKALQVAGFDVWWDADLPAHRSYSEVIERNLAEAKAVVVLWSKTAAQSQWVRAEADVARNAGKLVQAQVDRTIPPLPFNQIQCADLKGWRGPARHPGWVKLQSSVAVLVGGKERPTAPAAHPSLWQWMQTHHWGLAAALSVVLIALAAGLFFLRPAQERKPVLAVLPFRSLDKQDASLVAGMWEDTRTAIGRNPQLIVLGPNTVQQLAEKGEDSARKAADYLLEASVRTAGDRIRVSTQLLRSKDGEQVWSEDFDSKLDDVFALQSQIAGEIEGRIRGRLARSGGIKPEHIATTPDVYALYNAARADIRERDYSERAVNAWQQLHQVVKLDPNFAPGWAALAQIERIVPPSMKGWDTGDRAEEYARKAIDLAPNLAAGHAALAFALDFKGPVAMTEIQRAVQLDPNDFEAVTWLGNTRSELGDKKGALEAYTRAVQIEPLFWPAVLNKYDTLKTLGDRAGIETFVAQEERVGGDFLAQAIRVDQAYTSGNLAEAANLGLAYWASGKKEGRTVMGIVMGSTLLKLGFIEEAYEIGGPGPPFRKLLWLNDPKGVDVIESNHMDSRTFFKLQPLTENAGRVYVLSGRSAALAEKYLSLRLSIEDFSKLGSPEHFLNTAPIIAVALQQDGHAKAAAELLAYAEQQAKAYSGDGELMKPVWLARIYAAQGRKAEALPLLTAAVAKGWLPDPPELQTELNNDPAFAKLKGEPAYEKARQQINGTIARERAQVQLDVLHRAVAAK